MAWLMMASRAGSSLPQGLTGQWPRGKSEAAATQGSLYLLDLGFIGPLSQMGQYGTHGQCPPANEPLVPGNACGSGHRHRSSHGVGVRTSAGLRGLAA